MQNEEKAYRTRDPAPLLSLLAPDFTITAPSRKPIDRAAFEASLRQMLAQVKEVKTVRWTIDRLTLKGTTATVNSTTKMRLVMETRSKQNLTLATTNQAVEVWEKTASGWKVKSSVESKSESSVNGSPPKRSP